VSSKRALKALDQNIKNAETYDAWREACLERDRLSGAEEWKEDDKSPYYDYTLIRMRLNELRQGRARNDVEQLVFNLHEGLHGNLGNIANPYLYNVAKLGTKQLVVDYLQEVCSALEYLCDNDFPGFSFQRKLDFFREMRQAFGASALMLSGGAALGMFHMGVMKALWEQRLLPTVMSGSSAGSIMAAVLGTHTDDELMDIFDPAYLYVEAFRVVGWKGLLKGKPLLRGDQLETCLEKNVMDLTFEEAFRRTGRHINIPVSPADPHQLARVLNAKTSPNVLVRKAALASCAIPGVFPSVTLWAKNIRGEKVPYIPSRKWVDGSIKNDLPVSRLARLYCVNHTIVSQTNPHVVPFISRSAVDSGVPYFLRKWVTMNWTQNASFVLDILRQNIRNNEIALLVDKAHSIVSQRYVGDINLVPPRMPANVMRIMKNASTKEVAEFIQTGERATWPKIEFIRNTTCISRTFERCCQRLEEQERRRLQVGQLAAVS
jgi:predicted acylesterase/phospholipase RssA